MKYLDAAKARLGSVRNNDKTMMKVMDASSAGYLLIAVDMPPLIKIAEAAASLLAEDGAKEALSHYVVLQILADAVSALEAD